MKELIINKCMKIISKQGKYSDNEKKEIQYGLVSVYITITKAIFIIIISLFINIYKEVLIFMIFFNIIRTFAFGLHATKGWICWVASTFVFLLIPTLCKYLDLNTNLYLLLFLINVLLIFKNSPADTKKRPIVSHKRRIIFNTLSTIISIIYSICAITINNIFLTNCLLFALILENILISPLTYKVFELSYNNYIDFIKNHPDFNY